MNYLSLFSGIGGLDLGLDRAGMTCVGQVEKDPWCRRVLAKHWPEVPRHDDVRTAVDWWAGRGAPDLVAGGFPCQPFSTAGRQEGIADERWGWPWFWAVVRALRPRFVLVENVAALVILADLAAGGYDAEWDCIPAAAVGAPHLRDRLFLVAYAQRELVRNEPVTESRSFGTTVARDHGAPRDVADTSSDRRRPGRPRRPARHGADRLGLPSEELADSHCEPKVWTSVPRAERDQWAAEPRICRVAHGVPGRVDRLRGLGNAVVPQVAEHVGRLIMAAAA